jgi:hypothetical protein
MDIGARPHGVFFMFVLMLADGLFCVCFIYLILRWCCCPETSFIDWAQLSSLLPEDGERIQSPKCFVLNIKHDNG